MEAAMGVAGSATALAASTGDPVENVVVANCTVRLGFSLSLPPFLPPSIRKMTSGAVSHKKRR